MSDELSHDLGALFACQHEDTQVGRTARKHVKRLIHASLFVRFPISFIYDDLIDHDHNDWACLQQ